LTSDFLSFRRLYLAAAVIGVPANKFKYYDLIKGKLEE
jgi:hypothetical protein